MQKNNNIKNNNIDATHDLKFDIFNRTSQYISQQIQWKSSKILENN